MERLLKSRYKIGEKISENPFCVTYKGSLLDGQKSLIIKIYKRGTLNSNLINLMKQKVKERASITHHGVAKLFDGDYGWQGFYYVREYIVGTSLREILEGGQKIGPEKAVSIAEEICQALEAAHQRGIIHGALKPNNVFIDSKGIVKITDFVIVGEIKEAMPQKAVNLLHDGRYASPEELAGNPAAASSDIYALGMLLYEMAVSKSLLLEAGLSGSLAKLKNDFLFKQEGFSTLPKYLQDILFKALQVDLLLRFPSVAEFRESLENKSLVMKPASHEEYIDLFENTVTRYGEEDLERGSESLKDLVAGEIGFGKERRRNWILVLVLALAFLFGILYVFLFAW